MPEITGTRNPQAIAGGGGAGGVGVGTRPAWLMPLFPQGINEAEQRALDPIVMAYIYQYIATHATTGGTVYLDISGGYADTDTALVGTFPAGVVDVEALLIANPALHDENAVTQSFDIQQIVTSDGAQISDSTAPQTIDIPFIAFGVDTAALGTNSINPLATSYNGFIRWALVDPTGITSDSNATAATLTGNGANVGMVLYGALMNFTGNLDISNSYLSGTIPADIGNLSGLTQLLLNFNMLSGSIPPSLGNMSSLTHLSISNNMLTGSIPDELGNFPLLTQLSLSFNQLSGPIPEALCTLPSLTRLFLNANQLSGPIPASIGDLSGLTLISLTNNNISGTIPASLGNLSALQTLLCNNNDITGYVAGTFATLTAANTLRVEANNLPSADVDQIIIDADIAGFSGDLRVGGSGYGTTGNQTRTAASDAARTAILGRGGTVDVA